LIFILSQLKDKKTENYSRAIREPYPEIPITLCYIRRKNILAYLWLATSYRLERVDKERRTIKGAFIVKRHAHVYKDSQASRAAFKDFIADSDYQRSDSGMWYASHDDTHNFFSAAHPDKLLGIKWDTIDIAKDVNPPDKAVIIANCMNAAGNFPDHLKVAEFRGQFSTQKASAAKRRERSNS
jgi:hypothetical protein